MQMKIRPAYVMINHRKNKNLNRISVKHITLISFHYAFLKNQQEFNRPLLRPVADREEGLLTSPRIVYTFAIMHF